MLTKQAFLTLLAARQIKERTGEKTWIHTQRDPTHYEQHSVDAVWVTQWDEQYNQWKIWDRGVFQFSIHNDLLDIFEVGIGTRQNENKSPTESPE